jgi:monofunctional biosynthetic peptidoglycan transglycosylase
MTKKRSPAKKKRSGKFAKAFRLLRKIILIFFVSTILVVIAFRFINPPVTWLMVQRAVERTFTGDGWKIEKEWKNMDEISVNLKRAAIGGEDAHFMTHWGFDVQAIEKAYQKNQKGKRVRGGSTISQQTAKNVFLWPSRFPPFLWLRKGFEVYFTGLIELCWSKERILEVYLNVVETGDGTYGVEAASHKYFGKSASELSKGEAALIIAVLPNPLKWSPAKPTSYIYHRQELILANMRRLGKLNF